MDRPQADAPGVMSQPTGTYRSGFVGIIGRSNVGKSTLLNYYLGEKIAITSPKPQTTRNRVLGILSREDAQVLFLDTPGFHEPHHTLGRAMLETVKAAIDDADVLLVMLDSRVGLTEEDERVFTYLSQTKRPAFLALNKVDLIKKPRLLPLLEACDKRQIFKECIPVSALTGEQMDVLLSRLIEALPLGPHWYDPQDRTDQSTRQRIAELIREQIMLAVRQEVPHAVAVLVEQMEERERVTVVDATILVERPGQKAIIIGRGGAGLKHVGQAARLEIEHLLGRRVYLNLWVKVVEDWRGNIHRLRELGYV